MAFIDLKAQFQVLEAEIRAGIDRVLTHGKFIMGPEIGELEQGLAEFTDVRHAVTCASGTDALLLPLMAWEIGPGDAVFTTPYTFVATAEVISLLGATPVFVDIDQRTFNLNPDELNKAIKAVRQQGSLRPRCVVPVDLFGLPAEHDAIAEIAMAQKLNVLDDAAQAFGAQYHGRRLGGLGDACGVSFFPAKPLGCYGDGGAILTNDDALAETIRSIRVHGKGNDKYDNIRIGLNARMDSIQAAILLPKLRIFSQELEARQQVAEHYTKNLNSMVVETPSVPQGLRSAWAQYTVLCPNRDEAQEALKAAGIPTAVYYPKPLHLQTAFASLGHRSGDFPVSEAMSERVLSLPMHPYLEAEEIDRVCEELIRFVKRNYAPGSPMAVP